MTRWWDRTAGVVIDAVGAGLLVVLLLALAALVAAGWHFYPRWLPRRAWWDTVTGWFATARRWHLPRWRRPGRRRRRTREATPHVDIVTGDDLLPDLPAAEFLGIADRLAAQGRYAEAVRERLRGMVRELVEAAVISHHPEWTVTELARAAVARRPATGPPLTGATRVFSDIWYGQRPANAEHDVRMRGYADEVHAQLTSAAAAR